VTPAVHLDRPGSGRVSEGGQDPQLILLTPASGPRRPRKDSYRPHYQDGNCSSLANEACSRSPLPVDWWHVINAAHQLLPVCNTPSGYLVSACDLMLALRPATYIGHRVDQQGRPAPKNPSAHPPFLQPQSIPDPEPRFKRHRRKIIPICRWGGCRHPPPREWPSTIQKGSRGPSAILTNFVPGSSWCPGDGTLQSGGSPGPNAVFGTGQQWAR